MPLSDSFETGSGKEGNNGYVSFTGKDLDFTLGIAELMLSVFASMV